MTLHFIDSHFKRSTEKEKLASLGGAEESCSFCAILQGRAPSYKVYEDQNCYGFLDIFPIRPGHVLLIPKLHAAKLTDLDNASASALGLALPRLARAICRATDQPDFNVVNNNGYAQVVHHVHFHIVPAPHLDDRPRKRYTFIDNRYELDDQEAEELAKQIRDAVSLEAGNDAAAVDLATRPQPAKF